MLPYRNRVRKAVAEPLFMLGVGLFALAIGCIFDRRPLMITHVPEDGADEGAPRWKDSDVCASEDSQS